MRLGICIIMHAHQYVSSSQPPSELKVHDPYGNVVDALNHRLKDELLWRCVHNVYIGMQMRTHIHCTIFSLKEQSRVVVL